MSAWRAARAAALAERGWGDLAIKARLLGEGLPEPAVEAAVGELELEAVRAGRLTTEAGSRRKGWTLLQRRGSPPMTIETVLGGLDETDAEGLG
jgi:hypothetical protein